MRSAATSFDWTRLAVALGPAQEHFALADRPPQLAWLPAPLRWVARAMIRPVYGAARPLTVRQQSVNASLLEAVRLLGDRVRDLEAAPPAAPAPAAPPPAPDGLPNLSATQTTPPRLQFPMDSGNEFGPQTILQINNRWSRMLWPERLTLYATVYGMRPERCLEVGTFMGGSALIIAAALDDARCGWLVCVDPNPRVPNDAWEQFAHRCHLVAEPSPEALITAERKAGGKFDFALIDGDHSYAGVVRDIEGVLPVLADEAIVLFHDACNRPVADGIRDMLAKYAGQLFNVGLLSSKRFEDKDIPGEYWGGLQMVKFVRKT